MFSIPAVISVVEKLTHTLSEIFRVEIKSCCDVYVGIKHHGDDSRTYFLDELREGIYKRVVGSNLKDDKFKE